MEKEKAISLPILWWMDHKDLKSAATDGEKLKEIVEAVEDFDSGRLKIPLGEFKIKIEEIINR
jgi:hypothetical protein